jgi:hypothetical protein
VPGPSEATRRDPDDGGDGQRDDGVAIFDYQAMHAKTGIAHRLLRPVLGLVDPDNTRTLPGMVAACSGLDVLSHALESFTALPYRPRTARRSPALRPRIRAPIRSATSGRPAPSRWAANTSRARAPGGRRGARADAARVHVCRDWLRQRGRAPAARHVVPGVGHGARFPSGGLRTSTTRSFRTACRSSSTRPRWPASPPRP